MKVLSRTNFLEPEERVRHIEQASDLVRFRGIALFSLPQRDQLRAAIQAAIARGVRFQVLLMAPDNAALPHQLRDFSGTYLQQVRLEIGSGVEFWKSVLGTGGDVAIQTSGTMSGMAQVNEKRAILTPYSLSLPTADSPAFVVESATPMYRGAIEEFEFVWSNCAEMVT